MKLHVIRPCESHFVMDDTPLLETILANEFQTRPGIYRFVMGKKFSSVRAPSAYGALGLSNSILKMLQYLREQ